MKTRRPTYVLAACLACTLVALAGCSRPTTNASSASPTPSPAAGASWAHGTWAYGEMVDGYAWIEFAPGPDGRTGAFTERQYSCPTEERCRSHGTYSADATHVTLHSARWHDRALQVRTAANTMEWVENGIVVARLTLAPPTPPPAVPVEWPPANTPTPPAGTPCDALSAAQCGLAPACVLDAPPPQGPHEYRCRAAVGPCEGGVAQFAAPDFEADCNARPGCRVAPASCFCPCTVQTRVPGPSMSCDCACGGGAPRRCVAAAHDQS